MRTPWKTFPSLRDAIDVGGTPPSGYLIGALDRAALGDLLHGSALAPGGEISVGTGTIQTRILCASYQQDPAVTLPRTCSMKSLPMP